MWGYGPGVGMMGWGHGLRGEINREESLQKKQDISP